MSVAVNSDLWEERRALAAWFGVEAVELRPGSWQMRRLSDRKRLGMTQCSEFAALTWFAYHRG